MPDTTVVTRTYLEMTAPTQLSVRDAEAARAVPLERLAGHDVARYRTLYAAVGGDWHWRDRAGWSDEEIGTRLALPAVSVWVPRVDGDDAGFFELERHADGSVEIVYFGLLAPFMGLGLGRALLGAAVLRAWGEGAARVWLHTCSLDSPRALPNYVARGFRPYMEERYTVSTERGGG